MTELLSYRNQSTDLRSKSMVWFLYDNDLRHERIKKNWLQNEQHFVVPISLEIYSFLKLSKLLSCLYVIYNCEWKAKENVQLDG